MFTIEKILETAQAMQATDIYLMPERVPKGKVNGQVVSLKYPKLSEEDMEKIALNMMGEYERKELREHKETVFSFETQNKNRYRVNIFRQNEQLSCSIRCINNDIDNIDVSDDIMALTQEKGGVIVIAGKIGAGKSTLLSAIVEKINISNPYSIVSIEAPTEYIYRESKAYIIQQTIGKDTVSYKQAVKNALKMNCDILIVGEVSDKESIDAVIEAYQAGVLVLTTVNCAVETEVYKRINELSGKELDEEFINSAVKAVIYRSALYDNGKLTYKDKIL